LLWEKVGLVGKKPSFPKNEKLVMGKKITKMRGEVNHGRGRTFLASAAGGPKRRKSVKQQQRDWKKERRVPRRFDSTEEKQEAPVMGGVQMRWG